MGCHGIADRWNDLCQFDIQTRQCAFQRPDIAVLERSFQFCGEPADGLRTQIAGDTLECVYQAFDQGEVLAFQAWAYELQGCESEAVEVLERALALARPGGFMRTFADLHSVGKVLHEVRKRRKSRQEVDRKGESYVQQLLAAMNTGTAVPVSTEALLQQEGLEPLTDRELGILRLLEKDFTNKEIARQLVITTGTVKVHISNVYRKLSVNNRRAAVSLARALGLLPTEQIVKP